RPHRHAHRRRAGGRARRPRRSRPARAAARAHAVGAPAERPMIEFLGAVAGWFADAATWSGRNGIPIRLWEHLWISGLALGAAAAIGLPLGLVIGHTGRGATLVVAIANIGRAVPSLGLMGLAFLALLPLGLGVGPVPGIIALAALGIPPIV